MSKNKRQDATFLERVCPVCGRTFVAAPYHKYKKGTTWLCSWTCYNKHQPQPKKEAKQRGRAKE